VWRGHVQAAIPMVCTVLASMNTYAALQQWNSASDRWFLSVWAVMGMKKYICKKIQSVMEVEAQCK